MSKHYIRTVLTCHKNGGGAGGGGSKSAGGQPTVGAAGTSPEIAAQGKERETPTIQVTGRDNFGGTTTANVPVNPVTQEWAKGGQLKLRKNLLDSPDFQFGTPQQLKGFYIDRRDPRINDINRALRQEPVKATIHHTAGKNRVPFTDLEGTHFYIEF